MEDFDATKAKQIVESLHTDELHIILALIKNAAEDGESVLHMHKQLKAKTIEALRDRLFIVDNHPSIVIQRDDLHHSIYW